MNSESEHGLHGLLERGLVRKYRAVVAVVGGNTERPRRCGSDCFSRRQESRRMPFRCDRIREYRICTGRTAAPSVRNSTNITSGHQRTSRRQRGKYPGAGDFLPGDRHRDTLRRGARLVACPRSADPKRDAERTGYVPLSLREASRIARRRGQWKACRACPNRSVDIKLRRTNSGTAGHRGG